MHQALFCVCPVDVRLELRVTAGTPDDDHNGRFSGVPACTVSSSTGGSSKGSKNVVGVRCLLACNRSSVIMFVRNYVSDASVSIYCSS